MSEYRGRSHNICITTQRHSTTLNGTREVPSVQLKALTSRAAAPYKAEVVGSIPTAPTRKSSSRHGATACGVKRDTGPASHQFGQSKSRISLGGVEHRVRPRTPRSSPPDGDDFERSRDSLERDCPRLGQDEGLH